MWTNFAVDVDIFKTTDWKSCPMSNLGKHTFVFKLKKKQRILSNYMDLSSPSSAKAKKLAPPHWRQIIPTLGFTRARRPQRTSTLTFGHNLDTNGWHVWNFSQKTWSFDGKLCLRITDVLCGWFLAGCVYLCNIFKDFLKALMLVPRLTYFWKQMGLQE